MHSFATLGGEATNQFQIDECGHSGRCGRDWHVLVFGYCFPFDEKREFVWHVTEAEAKELVSTGNRVTAFKHDPPRPTSFNQMIKEQPEILWDALGIPVFNR